MLASSPSTLSTQVLSLVIASLLVMGSPGPSTISVTGVGAAFGWRSAFGYLLGAIAGTLMVLAAVASGVVAMLLATPQLAPILVGASALYILYLAFQIATAPPLSNRNDDVAAPSFSGGFLLAIANPKAYLAIAAVFANARLAVASPMLEALMKMAILALMIIMIHLAWLMVGASFARALRDPMASRIVNLLFAVILIVTTMLAFLS